MPLPGCAAALGSNRPGSLEVDEVIAFPYRFVALPDKDLPAPSGAREKRLPGWGFCSKENRQEEKAVGTGERIQPGSPPRLVCGSMPPAHSSTNQCARSFTSRRFGGAWLQSHDRAMTRPSRHLALEPGGRFCLLLRPLSRRGRIAQLVRAAAS